MLFYLHKEFDKTVLTELFRVRDAKRAIVSDISHVCQKR